MTSKRRSTQPKAMLCPIVVVVSWCKASCAKSFQWSLCEEGLIGGGRLGLGRGHVRDAHGHVLNLATNECIRIKKARSTRSAASTRSLHVCVFSGLPRPVAEAIQRRCPKLVSRTAPASPWGAISFFSSFMALERICEPFFGNESHGWAVEDESRGWVLGDGPY